MGEQLMEFAALAVLALSFGVAVRVVNRRIERIEARLAREDADAEAIRIRAEARRAHLRATNSSDTPAPGGAAAGSVDPVAPRRQG